MITSEIRKIYKKSKLNTGAAFYTVFYGDTTDEKPDFAQTDDKFVERNAETGQRKIYECTRTKGVSKWELIETIDGGGSDGGSSGGGGEPFVVTLDFDAQEGSLVGDKTYAEVYEAYTDGQRVIVSAEIENMFNYCADIISADSTADGLSLSLILSGAIQLCMCVAADANNYFTISLGG